KEGYDFTGWYLDEACTQKADSPFVLAESAVLYAGWKIQPKTLTFNSCGGTVFAPVTGEDVEIHLDQYIPMKEGWVFAGWFTDSEYQNPAPDPVILNTNITLFAKWKQPRGEASKKDCGQLVDKYQIWPGCEYIMEKSYPYVQTYVTKYTRVRVVDRYEQESSFLWISYTITMADVIDLDTGLNYTVSCNDARFYYPKEPFD
ncbi:MAG: InlB B-repeat-containing protein, partial [Erysipelotrichaceae bacterium]|nr:InlB B-repeat-containing protein [Erysipelotrichaceae bacterium]